MNTSFGQTLRQAREAKGLSTSQVAQRTRILVQIIEEMEHEDFHRIAAPIYGRGFVRLFAECVDLDPQPLIREFMDIYEGRRAPTVLVRDVPAAPAPEPPPVPEPPAPEPPPPAPPVPETPLPASIPLEPPAPAEPSASEPAPEPEPPPSAVRGLDLFDRPTVQTPFAAPASDLDLLPPRQPLPAFPDRTEQEAPAAPQAAALLRAGYAEAAEPSAAERFRKGLSSVSHGVVQSVRGIPRSAWRIALLALIACAVVGLAVFACAKLYQATSELPTAPAAPRPPAQETKGGLEILPTDPPQTRRPAPAAAQKPAPAAAQKPAPAAAQKRPSGALRSTGPRVPPLYAD